MARCRFLFTSVAVVRFRVLEFRALGFFDILWVWAWVFKGPESGIVADDPKVESRLGRPQTFQKTGLLLRNLN